MLSHQSALRNNTHFWEENQLPYNHTNQYRKCDTPLKINRFNLNANCVRTYICYHAVIKFDSVIYRHSCSTTTANAKKSRMSNCHAQCIIKSRSKRSANYLIRNTKQLHLFGIFDFLICINVWNFVHIFFFRYAI